MRRKVSHGARRNFRASHAGKTQRRNTLFGEIDLPDRVEKTSASAATRSARTNFQVARSESALSANGIWRKPAERALVDGLTHGERT